jgi:uncharacterized repeat protein (TIGR03806 family)
VTRRALSTVLLLAVGGCGGEDAPDTLARWALFDDAARQAPAAGVVPYEVVSELFMDHAEKHRFLSVPGGETISYADDGVWGLPVGTILIKTFGYTIDLRDPSLGERLLETRLLVHEEGGWQPYVYLWDEAQSGTTRVRAGARVPVEWIDATGATQSLTYRVPNEAQCEGCHGGGLPVAPLGPKTLQLDRDYDYGSGPVNQIDHLASLGLFDATPPPAASRVRFEDPFGTGDVELRARAYLDANCAHCHREGASASSSGLWLASGITDASALGVCRSPVAAGPGTGGRSFDIVPGDPDASIMVFRMESEEPGIKMPELPSQLSDAAGVALVREWITAMPAMPCL